MVIPSEGRNLRPLGTDYLGTSREPLVERAPDEPGVAGAAKYRMTEPVRRVSSRSLLRNHDVRGRVTLKSACDHCSRLGCKDYERA